jgi:tellurite resistance protein
MGTWKIFSRPPHGSTEWRGLDLVLQVMSAMAAADGEMETREINAIQQIYLTTFGRSVTGEDIRTAAEFVLRKGGLFELLSAASDSLSEATKEEIIRSAYLVLLADGKISDDERTTLKQIAVALKVPEVHFGSILESIALALNSPRT